MYYVYSVIVFLTKAQLQFVCMNKHVHACKCCWIEYSVLPRNKNHSLNENIKNKIKNCTGCKISICSSLTLTQIYFFLSVFLKSNSTIPPRYKPLPIYQGKLTQSQVIPTKHISKIEVIIPNAKADKRRDIITCKRGTTREIYPATFEYKQNIWVYPYVETVALSVHLIIGKNSLFSPVLSNSSMVELMVTFSHLSYDIK